MPVAVSQDSRTLLPTARCAEKHTSTWAFSDNEPDYPLVAAHYSTTDVPLPSAEAVRRTYRRAFLEGKILPALATEAGIDTMVRRWHKIPDRLSPEKQAVLLTDELVKADDALTEVATWADQHVPRHVGHSLPLPAPQAPNDRWQGAHRWVEGALVDPVVLKHPWAARIGRQHLPWLLKAFASFAEHGTGHGVTASNRTIGRRAAALVSEHIARGGSWVGRRTDTLSEETLASHVSALAAALGKAGWLRERARGRHLTLLERAVAWIRTHLHQTRAASLRDLTVPPTRRTLPTTAPAAPSWVHPGNVFYRQLTAQELHTTMGELLSLPVLHTYPHVVRLSYIVTVFTWLLTRKNTRETPIAKKKHPTTPPSPPTLPAQKLAAHLIQTMPWLLRGNTPGRQRHIGALARLIDRTDTAHVDAEAITATIDATLACHGWELHPATITTPLAWIKTVLKKLTP